MNRQIVDSRLRLDPDLRFRRPELNGLLKLWRDACAGRPVPDRADFSPFMLRLYLSRIIIYEVVGLPPTRRFRFRLYGTLVSKYSGRDPTGKFVDEVMSTEAYADFDKALSTIVDKATPVRATGSYHFLDRSFVQYESLTMPLTVGGTQIAQFLNVNYYDDED